MTSFSPFRWASLWICLVLWVNLVDAQVEFRAIGGPGLEQGKVVVPHAGGAFLVGVSKLPNSDVVRGYIAHFDEAFEHEWSTLLPYGDPIELVVKGVQGFQPGQEDALLALFDRHVQAEKALDPRWSDTRERGELHKNLAKSYRMWFETTGNASHFDALVDQYERATEVNPDDVQAWYNLAVNLYNRGVAVLKSWDHTTSMFEVMAMEEEFVAWLERSLGPLEQAHALEATRKETLKGLVMVHLALDNEEEEARYKAKLAQIVEGR